MSTRRSFRWWLCAFAAAVLVPLIGLTARAQFGFFRQAVGGVLIDANGVVTNADREETKELNERRLENLQAVPGDMNQPAALRKVSLRRLQEALARHLGQGHDQPPDEMRYLAGLQRIEYVFVYPELNDIVIAGFAEGWELDGRGNLVGKTTRRPVLDLDDLAVALRAADEAREGGILCSIDPTKEAVLKGVQFLATLPADPEVAARGLEQVMGLQTVRIEGVSTTTHFARVLLAADYRMKRIAMKFDRTPLRALPSFLDMIKAKGGNMAPRWWLATNYEPLLTDKDGLAWQLRGQGVKTMTEEEYLDAQGNRQAGGKVNPIAQKWAQLMTKHYDELSVVEPIFGELRNCMDLAVVAALIFKENLTGKAGCEVGLLMDTDRLPTFQQFPTPRQLPTIASYVKGRNGFVVSASGGVEIESWFVADKKEINDEAIEPAREAAKPKSPDSWWWN